MKLKRFLGISALAFMLVLSGCGSKKKGESVDKRLEKSFEAYSLNLTADDKDIEKVDNVTIVGNISIKTSELSLKATGEFKVDFKDKKFYLGGNVTAGTDKIAADVYGTADEQNKGVIYVRADEFMEDWMAITFDAQEMGLTDENKEIYINELLKIDFSIFKEIKEVETKNGITKIAAKLDLSKLYDEEIKGLNEKTIELNNEQKELESNLKGYNDSTIDDEELDEYGFNVPELTIYFYIDEDDRLTKIEFDGDELIKSGIFDLLDVKVEEFNLSFEFKDYGKTTIDIPEEAKNTENVVTAEDLISNIITMFFEDTEYTEVDIGYDMGDLDQNGVIIDE